MAVLHWSVIEDNRHGWAPALAAHASLCIALQVKNFGNEEVESAKFSTAVDKYNAAEYSMTMAFNVIGLLQGTIVFCATALGLVLCVKASPFASSCSIYGAATWLDGHNTLQFGNSETSEGPESHSVPCNRSMFQC